MAITGLEHDPVGNIIKGITADVDTRTLLLSSKASDTPAKDRLIDSIWDKIGQLDTESTSNLYAASLDYLSREDIPEGQNGRQAMLEVFPIIVGQTARMASEARQEARARLLDPLFKSLDKLNNQSDLYGSCEALLKAAGYIAIEARVLCTLVQRNNTTQTVRGKVMPLIDRLQSQLDKQYAFELLAEFEQRIFWGDPDVGVGNSEEEQRNAPKMNESEQVLHDLFLETTTKRFSLKGDLWQAIPQFRQTCAEYGIELERFWNKSNPDEIEKQLVLFAEQNPDVYQVLADKLQAVVDITDPDNKELIRVYADQIYDFAAALQAELLGSQIPVGSIIAKLETINRQEWRNPRARRQFLQQIQELVQDSGLDITGANLDADALEIIRATLQAKNNAKIQAAQGIDAIFNFNQYDNRFSIRARVGPDLYLADTTGDCTAYHLECGFNGHTVPVWLSMPNFVFSTINDDQGNMLAKVGLLLGLRDGKSCLVIDSVEASRLIQPNNYEEAGQQINQGLSAIKSWAQSIGLSDTYGYSFNNSGELVKQIEARSKEAQAEKFQLLGGWSGLHEYMDSVGVKDKSARLYLQTPGDDEPFMDLFEQQDRDKALSKFEKALTQIVVESNNVDLKPYLENADWTGLVKAYIARECVTLLTFTSPDNPLRLWSAIEKFDEDKHLSIPIFFKERFEVGRELLKANELVKTSIKNLA